MNTSRSTPAGRGGEDTPGRRLRRWWADPPRRGMQRLIFPWEYRHLRAFGVARLLGGVLATAAAAVCLAYAAYGWAAFFLLVGGLNLAGGCWLVAIARSSPPRT